MTLSEDFRKMVGIVIFNSCVISILLIFTTDHLPGEPIEDIVFRTIVEPLIKNLMNGVVMMCKNILSQSINLQMVLCMTTVSEQNMK